MIGKKVAHYQIIEKLGGGGMGIVYKAHDTKLDRFVALKFLPHHLSHDDDEKQRFIREAKAASALDHPNICTVYEISETADKQSFIAMAYYDGETLKSKIKNKKISIEEAIDIALEVGQGLKRAHQDKIIHRDIKPANIMITKNDNVKIVDFGLAKISDHTLLTKSGTTMGTVAYMSPEQVLGEQVDQLTDIWSLGVVLYEMLTGQLPFKGEYEQAIMYAIINKEPELLESYNPDFPEGLQHFIDKILDKDKETRYQNATEIINDLSILDSDPKSKLSKKPHIVNKGYFKLAIPIIVSIAALVILLFVIPQAESIGPIPIAVVDFVNETGDNELNGLSGMLTTALEQSKRLSVITRSRMFDILKKLEKENVDKIDEKLGREIANHAHIKVLVIATIRKFDQMYNIDLKVIDPIKDEYLFTAKENGKGKAMISPMIDQLAEKTREGLEESAKEIQQTTKPIAEITTMNLEAYQHYFLGQEHIDKLEFHEAENEFSKAIELDSTFGLAYYGLAYAINWENDIQRAKGPINEAFKYIDQIPDKEKYLVRFVRTITDSGWSKAGLKILKDMEKIYPDDEEMLYNIGDISSHIGELNEAKKYLEKVIKIDPKSARALQHLTWTYRDLGDYNQMAKIAEKYVAVSRSAEAYGLLAQAHATLGDANLAAKEYEKFEHALDAQFNNLKMALKVNKSDIVTLWTLSNFLTERGLAKLSIKCLNKIIIPDSLNVLFYNFRGYNYYFIAEFDKAEADLGKVLDRYPDNFSSLSALSMLLIATNRYDEAEKILNKLEKLYPGQLDTWVIAVFYAAQGQKEKALNAHKEKTTDVYALLGMKDEAIRLCAEWSELQRKHKYSLYYELKNTPFYNNIRSDPRFQKILAKDKQLYDENLRKYGNIDF